MKTVGPLFSKFWATLEEAVIYFGCMCLILPGNQNKITQITWFVIAVAISLTKGMLKYFKNAEN